LWFDPEKSRWGGFIAAALGIGDFKRLEEILRERAARGPIAWKWKSLLLAAR
jgi:putative ATPase